MGLIILKVTNANDFERQNILYCHDNFTDLEIRNASIFTVEF